VVSKYICRLSEPNIFLQVFSASMFMLRNKTDVICLKTDAFKKKLALWGSCGQKEDLQVFSRLHNFLTNADVYRKE